MRFRDNARGWGLISRLIHWAMAAGILFLLGLGFYMVNAESDLAARFILTQTHKSWGVAAFALALLRLAWRAANPRRPAPPAAATALQNRIAAWSHRALYALMLAMPVTGWLMASASPLQDAYGIPNTAFGIIALPDPFQPGGQALTDALLRAHLGLALSLTALLAIHAGAALAHHFVWRDNVLTRMMSGR